MDENKNQNIESNDIHIYYLTGWVKPKIHLTFDYDERSEEWHTISLKKSNQNRQLFELYIKDQSQVTFVFCDSSQQHWDNPNVNLCQKNYVYQRNKNSSYNYLIKYPGTYIIFDGKVVKYEGSNLKKKYIICSDLDGTLINDQDPSYYIYFKDYYVQHCLLNKNIVLVYSTGRNLESYLSLHTQNNMLFPNFLVTACGTNIIDMNQFENEEKSSGFENYDNYLIKISEFWNYEQIYNAFQPNFGQYLRMKPKKQCDYMRICAVMKFQELQQNFDKMNFLKQTLQKEINMQIHFIVSGQGEYRYIDIMPASADKGSALKYICEQILNVPIENAFAFGDSTNDCEMLRAGCRGVLVRNSQKDLLDWHEKSKKQFQNMEISLMQYGFAIIQVLQKLE